MSAIELPISQWEVEEVEPGPDGIPSPLVIISHSAPAIDILYGQTQTGDHSFGPHKITIPLSTPKLLEEAQEILVEILTENKHLVERVNIDHWRSATGDSGGW